MIIIENQTVHSDAEGMKVRRRGSAESGWSRMSLLPGETTGDFEEIEPQEEPPYSEEERKARIVALIRERYDESDEFALQRKMLAAMLHPEVMTLDECNCTETQTPSVVEEFETYNAFVEECKARATSALDAETAPEEEAEQQE